MPFTMLAAADTSTSQGGSVLVAPSIDVLIGLGLLVLAVLAIAWVALRGGRGRRFISVAQVIVSLCLLVTALGTGLLAYIVVGSSDSVSTGSPIAVYGDHVEADVRTGVTVWSGDGTGRAQADDGSPESQVRGAFGAAAQVREQPIEATVPFARPTTTQWIVAVVPIVLALAGALLILLPLRRLLADAARGAVFDAANSHRLRMIAGGIVLAGPVRDAVVYFALAQLVGSSAELAPQLHVALLPVVFAVAVLALAEVWRYGIALQRDAEATI